MDEDVLSTPGRINAYQDETANLAMDDQVVRLTVLVQQLQKDNGTLRKELASVRLGMQRMIDTLEAPTNVDPGPRGQGRAY